MSDEVSTQFAAALAIHDHGRISFGAAGAAAISPHFFAVGRLLSQKKKKPEPKAVIGTLTSVWDFGNRLQMRAVGDRFVLRFTRREDRLHVLSDGPWFYGRALFAVAEYDGLSDVASVPILTFPVWVEVLGLPPALMTPEAVELLGATLGHVNNLDRLGINTGRRAKVKVIHRLSDPIRAAFPPMTYEFGSAKVAVNLSFRYAKTVGFCRVCGLMEHLLGGCGGPPDLSGTQKVGTAILTPVRGVPPGFGSGNVGESSKNKGFASPNPSLGPQVRPNLGLLPPIGSVVGGSSGGRLSSPGNLFGGGTGAFGSNGGPSFAFSIPGMSPADMAASFARMCGTSEVVPEVPVPVVEATQAMVVLEPITGVKRPAGSEAVALGKRVRGPERSEVIPLELSFEPELALAHVDGHISVSPQKKRRVGRPKGSVNKPKVAVGEQGTSVSGPRKAKRRYKTRRDSVSSEISGEVVGASPLSGEVAGSGSMSGSSSVLESIAGSGVGIDLQTAGHGVAPMGDTIA